MLDISDTKKYFFLIIVTMFIFTNCNYQLYTDITEKKLRTTNDIKSIVLCSYDPFGSITQAIINELYANHIDIFNDLNVDDNSCKREIQIPVLQIISASEKHITASVFQNGKEAEYQLILYMKTNLFIPNKSCCPINIHVHRSFIRNPEKALFNDTQENNMRNEMYRDAAHQLMYQLFLQYEDF